MKKLIYSVATMACAAGSSFGQTAVTSNYTQTFDGIGTALPSGWTVRTGATATSLGTSGAFTTAAATWADTGGSFKNVASSDGLTSTATTAAQNASTDRALGVRQSGTFGDPGASFAFNINTTTATISAISLKAQMLSVQTRSTTWTIDYGIGAVPTSFTTIGTYVDPGTFGSTTLSFGVGDFGTALNNQTSVWIRVTALTASTGSGNRDTFGIDDFTITAVPEPHEYGIAFAGMLIALIVTRRRRALAG